MALRGAWWMPHPSQTGASMSLRPASATDAPYKAWLRKISGEGLAFNDLHKYLSDHPGEKCRISKLAFENVAHKLLWRELSIIRDFQSLEADVKSEWTAETYCHLYVITVLESKPLQVLAFYLDITPRFFNTPAIMLSTGNRVEKFVFFSIQLFEKYAIGQIPAESSRVVNPPRVRFRVTDGFAHHEWMLTRISLVFNRREDGKYTGVIHLDACDTVLRDGIKILAIKDEDPSPGMMDNKFGLSDILTEVFYIIQYTWGIFVQESEDYMKLLSKTCVENDLSAADQLTYTRELHKVAPLWVETRRRIVCAADLTEQMSNHPFFIQANAQDSIKIYLHKTKMVLNDHVSRTHELTNQTNVLISLIFNIATLQDTRAAVEESKAANQLASSIRRVTFITFIYLPLSLAAGIFGMNVREISGNSPNPPWWSFFVMASGLTFVTVVIWSLWSWFIKRRGGGGGALFK